jgi:hypothetical protein
VLQSGAFTICGLLQNQGVESSDRPCRCAPGCSLIVSESSLVIQHVKDLLILTALSYSNKLKLQPNRQNEVKILAFFR